MTPVTTEKEFVCSVCGTPSTHTILAVNEPPQGVPDLDLRPDLPHRNYLRYWVMECPCCGYCNSMLDVPADFSRDYVESDEYKNASGLSGQNQTADRMIRKALGCVKNHSYKEAVQSYLYASWLFDDDNNDASASACRRAAVRIFDEHPAAFRGDDNFKVLMADMMRRSGDFQRVVREYEGKAFRSQLMTAIAFFEVQLASREDKAAHRADEVPGVTAK